MQLDNSGEPLQRSIQDGASMAKYTLLVAIPIGLLVGLAIGAYDWTVNEILWKTVCTFPVWVQLAAPTVGMTLAGTILYFFSVHSSAMADEVVKAYHEPGSGMPHETAIGKLAASIATMGFGASAGMEGASKWLGATIGSVIQKLLNRIPFKHLHGNVRTTLLTGGSAGIAAIFRAPLSGAIMGVESPYKHDLAHEALIPSLAASAAAFWAFAHVRPATPYFPIHFQYTPTTRDILVAIPLGLSAGLASHLFLGTLAKIRKRTAAIRLPIPFRTALGGLMLTAIACLGYVIVGRPVTLQAGLPIANDLLNGNFPLKFCVLIFVLKLLATSITFGTGGVGGLFVPTATIGAALGACWDCIIPGHTFGVYTLMGIAAFSGASYNSLLFSAVFIAESTGNVFIVVPALLASSFAFLASAGVSNSKSQRKSRPDWKDNLASVSVTRIMTTQLVTLAPNQSVETFANSVLHANHYKALPVIDEDGVLEGMLAIVHLRGIPIHNWPDLKVSEVMDRDAQSVFSENSAADALAVLRDGRQDYVPVVEQASNRLVGIVSHSDVHKALTQNER